MCKMAPVTGGARGRGGCIWGPGSRAFPRALPIHQRCIGREDEGSALQPESPKVYAPKKWPKLLFPFVHFILSNDEMRVQRGGRPLLSDTGGGGGQIGPPGFWLTHPPTHIRKFFLRKKMKFIKGARTWRSILGTQTFFWPLSPPPPRYSINRPLSKGLRGVTPPPPLLLRWSPGLLRPCNPPIHRPTPATGQRVPRLHANVPMAGPGPRGVPRTGRVGTAALTTMRRTPRDRAGGRHRRHVRAGPPSPFWLNRLPRTLCALSGPSGAETGTC